MEQSNKTKFNIYNLLRNLFFIILILQFTPSLITNVRNSFQDTVNPKTHVGYLNISGPIYDSSFYVKKIEENLEDTDIKALLLKINSPGGYPASCQAIFHELLRFKKKKPIVVFVENSCASGGYYIACAANKIFANAGSIVGSVGVVMELPNVKGLLNNWMINYTYVQAGEYKTAGSPVKELSAKELEHLQGLANDNYREFIKDIRSQRSNVDPDEKIWANGKIFTGSQALELNLIDQLGSYSDALDEIKKQLNLSDDDKIKLIKPKKASGLVKLLGNEDEFGQDTEIETKVATFLCNVYQKMVTQSNLMNNNIQMR